MKKTSITKPTENKIAPQYGFRKLRPLKIPKMAWYALLLAFVMAVTLFVLYLITFIGTKDTKRTLLIYNDGSTIPEVSLRNSLAASEFGYEIMCEKIGNQNWYYVADRLFSDAEIKMLIDAVQAANFIPEGKTDELTRKLAHLSGLKNRTLKAKNLICYNVKNFSEDGNSFLMQY